MLNMINEDEIFSKFDGRGFFTEGDHTVCDYPSLESYPVRVVFVRCDASGMCQLFYLASGGYGEDIKEAIEFDPEHFEDDLKALFSGSASKYVNPVALQKLLMCARKTFTDTYLVK